MNYFYQAKDASGNLLSGGLDVASLAEARQKLRGQGLFVISIAAEKSDRSGPKRSMQLNFGNRVRKADLLILLSQLTIMSQSGVDLAESLRNLALQCNKPALKRVVQQIYDDVSRGTSLSAAMRKHPHVFDETFIAGITAGESTGTITTVLDRLTYLTRTEIRLRSTLWSLLMYPIVLCGVTLVVINALIFFVLPQFAKVFDDLGRAPPPLTRFLLAAGAFARGNAWLLIAIGVGGIVAAAVFRSTLLARTVWDYVSINGLIVRNATRSLITGRLFRLLATMLQSGVPLVDGIRLCRQASRNRFFRKLFEDVEHDALQGKGISKALLAASFLPTGAAHMVATAERQANSALFCRPLASTTKTKASVISATSSKSWSPPLFCFWELSWAWWYWPWYCPSSMFQQFHTRANHRKTLDGYYFQNDTPRPNVGRVAKAAVMAGSGWMSGRVQSSLHRSSKRRVGGNLPPDGQSTTKLNSR